MGQAIRKFSSGLLPIPIPIPTNIVAFPDADDPLRKLLSLLSENGEITANSTTGDEEKKGNKIGPTIKKYYDEKIASKAKNFTEADFFRAVAEIVQEINKDLLDSTQFLIPDAAKIESAYKENQNGNEERMMKKEEFEKIVQQLVIKTGITGTGAKDSLFYIYGVPVSALLIKQKVLPKAIPNEIFIPLITSATVLVLAKLHKI